ncbi:MAG: DNA/RNA non-specific endonuclease [Bacteroidaceae bacterium]|nr:DNA/RNA non-specific endonuclease [Bacteroidaceae bacterium]
MNRNRTYWGFAALAVVAVSMAFVACDNDDDRYDMPSDVVWRSSGKAAGAIVTTPYEERIEVPARKAGNTFVAHTVQFGGHEVMNFCVEYDPNQMHSRWVAFRFDGDTRQRNVSRSNEPFADDPKLPSNMRIGSGTFGWPYSRGHLVASADRLFSQEANEQTFYMSNMSPQISNFNAPYWSRLENIVQNHGHNSSFADTLYVVKGGYIDDDMDLLGWQSRGNGKSVAVPGHYFMALLRVKGASYNSIAFWIEHKDYGYDDDVAVPKTVFQDNHQIVSVDELEQLTGIDFFHNLPDDIENKVEAEYSVGLWMN